MVCLCLLTDILQNLVAIVGGLFVLWFLILNFWKPKNYPTGPLKIPLIGNFCQVILYVKNRELHKLFVEYSKIYGRVFSFQLGSYSAVVINDYKLIKEAWNNPNLLGRNHLPINTERCGDGISRGILFQEGEEWSDQRRFTLRHLRDFGFGKKSMESLIMDEVLELLDRIKKENGQPISTKNRFNLAVLNALWTITAGERFSHDDPELTTIVEAVTRNVGSAGPAQVLFFMPWILRMFPNLPFWKKYKADLPYPYNFLKKFTQDRIQNFNPSDMHTFVDVYIDEMKRTKDPNSSFYGKRGELTLTATLLDLFLAGAETTSTTLSFACLYLASYPEIQEKLYQEIHAVLGAKLPAQDDRSNMPYTDAVIMETLRFSSMVPLGVFHRATENVQLGEYFIPKNTMVIANQYAAHYDPQVWGDPELFRPERFLSPDGTTVLKNEALIAFSAGKRLCLGESLAKNELFLFISSIFQKFQVKLDPSRPKPTFEQNVNIVTSPKPHHLIFEERK